MMRARLKSLLPEEISGDELRFEMLDLLLSFEAWNRLRRDQGLSARRAAEVVAIMAARITG